MDTTVMTFEGVLANVIDRDHIVSAAPIKSGVTLYHALKTVTKLVVISDMADREMLKHWLDYWKLTDHVGLRHRPQARDLRDEITVRLDLLEQLRHDGHSIAYVVDANPRICAACLHAGMGTLVFASPWYQRTEFQPNAARGIRAWNEIQAEVDRQRAMKDKDERLVPAETGDNPWRHE